MAPGERLTTALHATGDNALPALVPYVTAGYPQRGSTVPLLLAAQDAGCAVAEIGVPFSDPLADGPTIQRAGRQALDNGMTLALAVEAAAAARDAGVTIPLAVMTYLNPVLSRGVDVFCREAAAAGIDGVIVPDLPAGEASDVRETAAACGVALVPLVAPTTTGARLATACHDATGFVYCVSRTGTTGARDRIAPDAFDLLDRVRGLTHLPRALGFGLSRHEHLVALRGRCEAAVVGSALIDAVGADPANPARAAARFLRAMLAG